MKAYIANFIVNVLYMLLWGILTAVMAVIAVPSMIIGKPWLHNFVNGFVDGLAQRRMEEYQNSLFGKAVQRLNEGESTYDD